MGQQEFDPRTVETRVRTAANATSPFDGLLTHPIVTDLPSDRLICLCLQRPSKLERSQWCQKDDVPRAAATLIDGLSLIADDWNFSFVQVTSVPSAGKIGTARTWKDAIGSTISEFWLFNSKYENRELARDAEAHRTKNSADGAAGNNEDDAGAPDQVQYDKDESKERQETLSQIYSINNPEKDLRKKIATARALYPESAAMKISEMTIRERGLRWRLVIDAVTEGHEKSHGGLIGTLLDSKTGERLKKRILELEESVIKERAERFGRSYAQLVTPTPDAFVRLFGKTDNTTHGTFVRQNLCPDLLTLIIALYDNTLVDVNDLLTSPLKSAESTRGGSVDTRVQMRSFVYGLSHADDGLYPERQKQIIVTRSRAFLLAFVDTDTGSVVKCKATSLLRLIAALDQMMLTHSSEYYGQLTPEQFYEMQENADWSETGDGKNAGELLSKLIKKTSLVEVIHDLQFKDQYDLDSFKESRKFGAFPVRRARNMTADAARFGKLLQKIAADLTFRPYQSLYTPAEEYIKDILEFFREYTDKEFLALDISAQDAEKGEDESDESSDEGEKNEENVSDSDASDVDFEDVEPDEPYSRSDDEDGSDDMEVDSISDRDEPTQTDPTKSSASQSSLGRPKREKAIEAEKKIAIEEAAFAAKKKADREAKKEAAKDDKKRRNEASETELESLIRINARDLETDFRSVIETEYKETGFVDIPRYFDAMPGRIRTLHVVFCSNNVCEGKTSSQADEIDFDAPYSGIYALQWAFPVPAFSFPKKKEFSDSPSRIQLNMAQQAKIGVRSRLPKSETSLQKETSTMTDSGARLNLSPSQTKEFHSEVLPCVKMTSAPDNSAADPIAPDDELRIPMFTPSSASTIRIEFPYNVMPLVTLIQLRFQIPLAFKSDLVLQKVHSLDKWDGYAIGVVPYASYVACRMLAYSSPFLSQKTPIWSVYPPTGYYEFWDPRSAGLSAIVRKIAKAESRSVQRLLQESDQGSFSKTHVWHVPFGLSHAHWTSYVQPKTSNLPGMVFAASNIAPKEAIQVYGGDLAYESKIALGPVARSQVIDQMSSVLKARFTNSGGRGFAEGPFKDIGVEDEDYASPALDHYYVSGFAPVGFATAENVRKHMVGMFEAAANGSMGDVATHADNIAATLVSTPQNQHQRVSVFRVPEYESRESVALDATKPTQVAFYELDPAGLYAVAQLLELHAAVNDGNSLPFLAERGWFSLSGTTQQRLMNIFASMQAEDTCATPAYSVHIAPHIHRHAIDYDRMDDAQRLSVLANFVPDRNHLAQSIVDIVTQTEPPKDRRELTEAYMESFEVGEIAKAVIDSRDLPIRSETDLLTEQQYGELVSVSAEMARPLTTARQLLNIVNKHATAVMTQKSFRELAQFYSQSVEQSGIDFSLLVKNGLAADPGTFETWTAVVQKCWSKLSDVHPKSYLTLPDSAYALDVMTYIPAVDLLYRCAGRILRDNAAQASSETPGLTKSEESILNDFRLACEKGDIASALIACQFGSNATKMASNIFLIHCAFNVIDISEAVKNVAEIGHNSVVLAAYRSLIMCADVIQCLYENADLSNGLPNMSKSTADNIRAELERVSSAKWRAEALDAHQVLFEKQRSLTDKLKRLKEIKNAADKRNATAAQKAEAARYAPDYEEATIEDEEVQEKIEIYNESMAFYMARVIREHPTASKMTWPELFEKFPNLKKKWETTPLEMLFPVYRFNPGATVVLPNGTNQEQNTAKVQALIFRKVSSEAEKERVSLFDTAESLYATIKQYYRPSESSETED